MFFVDKVLRPSLPPGGPPSEAFPTFLMLKACIRTGSQLADQLAAQRRPRVGLAGRLPLAQERDRGSKLEGRCTAALGRRNRIIQFPKFILQFLKFMFQLWQLFGGGGPCSAARAAACERERRVLRLWWHAAQRQIIQRMEMHLPKDEA